MYYLRKIFSFLTINLFILFLIIYSFLVSCEKIEPEKVIKIPIVTSSTINIISLDSAQGGGNISNDGGGEITARGVCWSYSSNPTTADNFTNEGGGTGDFTCELAGLRPNIMYYVRAYATNSAGVAYGDEINFSIVLHSVTTTTINNITDISAQVGGTIAESNENVIARGVCWSTSENPIIDDDYTDDGSGTGSFTSTITGLAPYTRYFVRTYATSSIATAYGNEMEFTTDATVPTVLTTAIYNLTDVSVRCEGNVTYNGGAEITARGICWSNFTEPEITDNTVPHNNNIGSFICELTDLFPNTIYYIRAYATNSAGTAYGDEISFKTYNDIIFDIEGNSYYTILIGTQEWMAENLRVTKYNDGTDIPLVIDDTEWTNLTTPAYCWCENDSLAYADSYGALYNWYTVETDSLCPTGWHVSTDEEWQVLLDYLSNNGYSGIEGPALKATYGWDDNGNGTDDFSFTALPGGARHSAGIFVDIRINGFWWSATEYDSAFSWNRIIYYNFANVGRYYDFKSYGFSVRCVKYP